MSNKEGAFSGSHPIGLTAKSQNIQNPSLVKSVGLTPRKPTTKSFLKKSMQFQWFLPLFGLQVNMFCFCLHFFYDRLNLEYFLCQQVLLV